MTLLSKHARHALAVVAVALCTAGCAKDPTTVNVTVNADATAPPILILRTTVTDADDPSRVGSSERSSPYASDDAADRPGPFAFPTDIPLTIDPTFAGPVIVTVEGLDWDTHAVIAAGSTTGSVVAQATTMASLTLTAVTTGGAGDGGTD
jgi:hypothetical protein